MGRRGPAPKPDSVKRLRGTARESRGTAEHSRARQAQPKAMLPKPPTHLDAVGQAAWRRLVAALDTRGILEPELDFGLIESWCSTYAQWRAAQSELKRHGLTYTMKTGYVGQRPEVAIAHKAKLLLKGLSAELGLSAAARARMNLPNPEPGLQSINDLLMEALLNNDDEAIGRLTGEDNGQE